MKQHITKEQWDELDEKQKDMFCKQQGVDKDLCVLIYVDINIGQMIEFLGDGWKDAIFKDLTPHSSCIVENRDLCDALWEAVKHKLNN